MDQLHFFTMAIYLLCGTALFIGSSIFLYFDKDYEGVNKTIIFLLLNIVCLIFFAISIVLLKFGKRHVFIRLLPSILGFINYLLVISYISSYIRGIKPHFSVIACLSYLILNSFYQVLIIDFCKEKSTNFRSNLMYLPFGICASFVIISSIIETILNTTGNLYFIIMLVLVTIFYQLVMFEFVFATKGEKIYQEQMKKSRYGGSVSSLLKNKGN
ncbi:hypothetical protein DIY14_08180 [Streptococcus iniae]|uniref:Uncharacterized protein n=1 Tax=Streptococcus iniae TaxID=1346 RepID=A0ABN4D9U7_STRIN|nr:hypothetical protein DQ08_08700 [Streptococcus iniae]AHY18381.1 hypothetical protein DW64_08685 [Streptococcus iniae]ELY5750637.1 hypothetical protein [Streptococcus iniae]ELY5752576.1 hypothetical protein [Streptococcus iniae]RLU27963.1 hypothetical protein DIY15_08090 [Streptococcus iniae]